MNTNPLNICPLLLSNIQKITLKNIIPPTIPIAIYLQEIENLAVWATDDLMTLEKVGIKIDQIEDLKQRIDACRILQTEWLRLKKVKPDMQKEWEQTKRKAIATRDELMFTYKYAFRNNNTLLKELKKINKKNIASELVGDISTLCRIGNSHLDLLQKISFDPHQIQEASLLAREVQDEYSYFIVDTPDKDRIKTLRDKSYTYLKQLADEIKGAGKFVFTKNKERLQGYQIAYYKMKKTHLKADADIK